MRDHVEPMRVDLRERVAIVTGGGTGIGRAIAVGLARCGASVVVNYRRSRDAAEHTVQVIADSDGRAVAVEADVTDEARVEALMGTTWDQFGGLDILVANAGGPTQRCPTAELDESQWDRGLGLNCKSVFLCVKHAIGRLTDGKGRIVVTSSISARTGGGPGMVTYAAAKGAINNMVRGWAKELAPRGITVNAIAPGIIRTRLHERWTDPDDYGKLIERIPLGRDGTPEDCVGPVLMLASDDGAYITGQVIEINGGMAMP